MVLIGVLFLFPPAATAHPLDEYYQVTYITVVPNRITLQIELYPGILIAPRILALIDTDQDDRISEAESRAYINLFLTDITFEIEGQSTSLTLAQHEFSSPMDLRAGVGVIRFELYTDLPADHRGNHQLFYENNHQPDKGVYLVNAIGDAAHWVNITQQERDIFQRSIHLDYTIKPDAPIDYGAADALTKINVPGGVSEGQKQLTRYLYETSLSPLVVLIALGLSATLGGLHALTPGHGKTLVAAYLIGSRGTASHAIALGGIVTFTHTASVIVIGLLALLASQFIVPNVLVPSLEILSGLLVVGMGFRLLWTRWNALKKGETHNHPHDHDYDHPDEHEHLPNHHSQFTIPPKARKRNPQFTIHHLPESVKLGDLLTLGISGGLVPCPEALGVMLIAIGLNRILLGLGLIVAFSFGLAAVLIIIGILLVRSKSLLNRLSGVGGRWQTLLPLASAFLITLLGIGIVAKGLLAYL